MLEKMAGKCSILLVLHVLIWTAYGQGGVSQKDPGKRLQEVEDRIQWLTKEHRNMTNVVAKIHHRLHTTHHKMTEIKEEELLRGKLITDMRDQLEKQSYAIDRLQQDNQQMRGVILQLSQAVQNIRGQPLGTTLAPIVKTTKSTLPTTPRDCQDVFNGGSHYAGNYYITVEPTGTKSSFKVCCQMTDGAGWTILMRRMDGSIDFFKKWDEFKRGFGNLEAEFWLGNDKIHELTSQGDYMLRIEMESWEGKKYYAEYDHFSIADEADKYRIHVSGYHGNAGDSLTSYWEDHNNQAFSTRDRDNDDRFYDNCAEHYHGAWWFKSCFESHLNGIYYRKGEHNNYFVRNGIQWNTIHLHSSLKYAAMLVKPSTKASDPSRRNDTVD